MAPTAYQLVKQIWDTRIQVEQETLRLDKDSRVRRQLDDLERRLKDDPNMSYGKGRSILEGRRHEIARDTDDEKQRRAIFNDPNNVTAIADRNGTLIGTVGVGFATVDGMLKRGRGYRHRVPLLPKLAVTYEEAMNSAPPPSATFDIAELTVERYADGRDQGFPILVLHTPEPKRLSELPWGQSVIETLEKSMWLTARMDKSAGVDFHRWQNRTAWIADLFGYTPSWPTMTMEQL